MSDTQVPAAPPESVGTRDEERLKPCRDFIDRLKALDKGELAMLRRNSGLIWPEARGVAWFFRLLDAEGRGRDMECFFLIATLYASTPERLRHPKQPAPRSFAGTLAQVGLRPNTSAEAVERRFRILLDAEFDRIVQGFAGGEMAFRLRQSVKLAAAKEVSIDWPRLLDDLRRWTHPEKRVQRQWAQDFYAPPPPIPVAPQANAPSPL
ncbi:MAG: type I-E CRISPR-associated protein Cse2/CasB [Armatimonadetes bacterium]|nr:type I-E CRISPR-associated protein Cse2/CasB [Armatimonadota bacterium]